MLMDIDNLVKSEFNDEDTGIGSILGKQTDEGDWVLDYQYRR